MNSAPGVEKIKGFLELRIQARTAILIIVLSCIFYVASGYFAYRLIVWNRVEGSLSLNKEIARLKNKLDSSPSDIELNLDLARALHIKKEYKEARLRYEHVLELDGNNSKARYFLGMLLAEIGDAAKAIDHLKKVIAKDRSNAQAYYALGLAYKAQDDEINSVNNIKKAIRLQPSSATFHYELGRTLELWAKEKEAIDSYKEALKFDPEYLEARDALKRLKAVN